MWQKVKTWFIGKSWKTTLIGYASAACSVLLPVLQSGQLPTKENLIAAGCFALLGRFSKDHDVTGKAVENGAN